MESQENEMVKSSSTIDPSKGGKARAAKLSPEHRKEIAQQAAEARWGALPQAILDGKIIIADREIACAVLENGMRLLTQETFMTAIGRNPRPKAGTGTMRLSTVDGLPPFLAVDNLKPFINDKIRESTTPIIFRSLKGKRAFGYDARLLPMVCEVYLKARDKEALTAHQEHIAFTCDILMRGLAHVGIIALVDEATGYQEQRTKNELNQLLQLYVQEELRPYISKFPNEFFKQIYRLYGWPYKPGSTKRPSVVGKFINKYIYQELPPNVLPKLQELNPMTEKGWRRWKHTQFLAETGNEHLDKQVTAVTFLMKVSDDMKDYDDKHQRAFAKEYQQRLPLVINIDTGETKREMGS
jgi:hypothetical protein